MSPDGSRTAFVNVQHAALSTNGSLSALGSVQHAALIPDGSRAALRSVQHDIFACTVGCSMEFQEQRENLSAVDC